MYVSLAEVRASAQGMTTSAVPAATDDLVRDLIERASRMFDRQCGVPEEYFESALYPVWESGHVYVVGEIVTPTTANAHRYRVTTAGTSGASEPIWPTSSGGPVTNGNVVFTEHGADVVASARTFYPGGLNHLKLDPYVAGTLTGLTVPSGYETPYYVQRGGYLIRTGSDYVLPVTTSDWIWNAGVPVTVTAKWGFSETPADVRQAVIELVINLWREVDPASQKLVNLDGMALRESLPPRVREIARHRRLSEARTVFA